jgi:phospholipase/carboxylesterase
MGLSNGANFAASVMGLQPGHIRKAILLRPMMVLEEPPEADLRETEVLMIAGARDPFAGFGAPLAQWLERSGAVFDLRTISAGHELSGEDEAIAREWLHMRTDNRID